MARYALMHTGVSVIERFRPRDSLDVPPSLTSSSSVALDPFQFLFSSPLSSLLKPRRRHYAGQLHRWLKLQKRAPRYLSTDKTHHVVLDTSRVDPCSEPYRCWRLVLWYKASWGPLSYLFFCCLFVLDFRVSPLLPLLPRP